MSNDIKRNDKWYEDNKERILDLYYNSNKSLQGICDELICGRSKLIYKIKEWGVFKRPHIKNIENNPRYNAKYNVDYEYFDNIDDEHKAYWLGFLLADGYVDNRCVMFCLGKKDIESVKAFKEDLNAEHPIRYNKDGNPIISITCKRLCGTLMNYGFHHDKSHSFDMSKILKVIPEKFENHFIRGMFDGDGSIKYYKYDYQNVPFYHFGYTGLKNVCDYVAEKLDLDTIVQERDTDVFSVKSKNPHKIIEIYNYLYKDATIYMQRKYNTFQEIIEIEKKRDLGYSKTGTNMNRDRCRYITYNGETHSIKEWSEIRNIPTSKISNRINTYHWSIGRALEYEQ